MKNVTDRLHSSRGKAAIKVFQRTGTQTLKWTSNEDFLSHTQHTDIKCVIVHFGHL